MTDLRERRFALVVLGTQPHDSWCEPLVASLAGWEDSVSYCLKDASSLLADPGLDLVLTFPTPHRHIGRLLRDGAAGAQALEEWAQFVSTLLQFQTEHNERVLLAEDAVLRQDSVGADDMLRQTAAGRVPSSRGDLEAIPVVDQYELRAAASLLQDDTLSLYQLLRASAAVAADPVDVGRAVEVLATTATGSEPAVCECEDLRSENVLLVEQMHHAQIVVLEYVAKKDASDRAVRDKKAKLVDLSRKLRASRMRVVELRRELREERARIRRLRQKYEDRGHQIQRVRAQEKETRARAQRAESELTAIRRSRAWKVARLLRKVGR